MAAGRRSPAPLIVLDEPRAGSAHFALLRAHRGVRRHHRSPEGAGAELSNEPSSREDFGRTVWAAFLTDPFGNAIEITDVGPLQPA